MKIEVMTNYRQRTILLKQGKFFLNLPLSDADEFLKEVSEIKAIMQTPIQDLIKRPEIN